jgi:peptide subunit release factor 1 (eRF1)
MATRTSTATKTLESQLQQLAAFQPTSFPVLSLYLDLSANQHGRDQHGAFVRKVLTERAKALPDRSPERESFDQDVVRIEAYLRDDVKASTNGLAIFACAGASGFFDAVQLQAPVERHWLFVGPVPHLYPLVRLAEQHPRYAAVMLDTNRAQIFVFGLNAVEQQARVESDKTKRTSVGGWSQARFQRRVENFHQQHVKEVVDALDKIVAAEQLSRIVVVGDDVVVPLLRAELPQRLADSIVDVVRLEHHAGEQDVLQATLEALRTKDAETDGERVAQVMDNWRAGGLGVVGSGPTLEALQLGQVDELLLTSRPQHITSQRTAKVPLENEVIAVDTTDPAAPDAAHLAIADELVTRAQQTGARVRFIEDPALLEPVGGVAALLRFRL